MNIPMELDYLNVLLKYRSNWTVSLNLEQILYGVNREKFANKSFPWSTNLSKDQSQILHYELLSQDIAQKSSCSCYWRQLRHFLDNLTFACWQTEITLKPFVSKKVRNEEVCFSETKLNIRVSANSSVVLVQCCLTSIILLVCVKNL